MVSRVVTAYRGLWSGDNATRTSGDVTLQLIAEVKHVYVRKLAETLPLKGDPQLEALP